MSPDLSAVYDYALAINKVTDAQSKMLEIQSREIETLRAEIKFLRGMVGGISVLVITLFALHITS